VPSSESKTKPIQNRKEKEHQKAKQGPTMMMEDADEPLVADYDEIDDDEPPILVNLEDVDDEPPVLVNVESTDADSVPAVVNPQPAADLPPCPVTILSGFLGSGKTTLIRYILSSPDHGKRIAVIENEFGDGLSVESLIARDGLDPSSNSLQDLIELPNGCICCTVKDDLVTTLESLITKRQDLDYILIEASGMANPGPIAAVFWLDDALESRLRLDGIVTLVDAHHIQVQLEETEEASQQIAYADRLLVNKIDLVQATPNGVDSVLQAIRAIHPTAPIRTTSYSQVPDLEWILDANCFGGMVRHQELDRMLEAVGPVPVQPHAAAAAAAHDHSHHHDHATEESSCETCRPPVHHKHTSAISTIALSHSGSVDSSKMNAWLAEALWPNQDAEDKVLRAMLEKPNETHALPPQDSKQQRIYRIKGILSVLHNGVDDIDERYKTRDKLDTRRHIVQAVHDLWDIHAASDDLQWASDEERTCKVVVIGRHLQSDVLKQGFLACFPQTII
jgi:G3E family GTPase